MVPQSVLTTAATTKAGQSAPSNCDSRRGKWRRMFLFSAALRDMKGRTESALTLSRGASLYTKLKQLLNMGWEYSIVTECLPSVLKP